MGLTKKVAGNWLLRHLAVIVVSATVVYLLLLSRAEWSPMHRWNRAVGDMSLALVAAAMALGPLSRLWRPATAMLAFRREFGIYAILLALIHTVVILVGWVELDLLRLFGLELHPGLQRYVMVQHGFALANGLGLLALMFGAVLAVTSNDLSMRWLGDTVWKFVQQGSYVLWWLAVGHTAYFLFVHFLDFHRPTPEPNWAQWPFVVLVTAVVGVQLAATVQTWRRAKRRGVARHAWS